MTHDLHPRWWKGPLGSRDWSQMENVARSLWHFYMSALPQLCIYYSFLSFKNYQASCKWGGHFWPLSHLPLLGWGMGLVRESLMGWGWAKEWSPHPDSTPRVGAGPGVWGLTVLSLRKKNVQLQAKKSVAKMDIDFENTNHSKLQIFTSQRKAPPSQNPEKQCAIFSLLAHWHTYRYFFLTPFCCICFDCFFRLQCCGSFHIKDMSFFLFLSF